MAFQGPASISIHTSESDFSTEDGVDSDKMMRYLLATKWYRNLLRDRSSRLRLEKKIRSRGSSLSIPSTPCRPTFRKKMPPQETNVWKSFSTWPPTKKIPPKRKKQSSDSLVVPYNYCSRESTPGSLGTHLHPRRQLWACWYGWRPSPNRHITLSENV